MMDNVRYRPLTVRSETTITTAGRLRMKRFCKSLIAVALILIGFPSCASRPEPITAFIYVDLVPMTEEIVIEDQRLGIES